MASICDAIRREDDSWLKDELDKEGKDKPLKDKAFATESLSLKATPQIFSLLGSPVLGYIISCI